MPGASGVAPWAPTRVSGTSASASISAETCITGGTEDLLRGEGVGEGGLMATTIIPRSKFLREYQFVVPRLVEVGNARDERIAVALVEADGARVCVLGRRLDEQQPSAALPHGVLDEFQQRPTIPVALR